MDELVCPCPFDPCPMPPSEFAPEQRQGHRSFWAEWERTGRCPSCGVPLNQAEAIAHACPNRVIVA